MLQYSFELLNKMTQEAIENQIQENGYGIGSILVCGMIAALIMIMAYKYNQKRRQKYLKCELLPENQDSNHADGNHRSITFPFVLSLPRSLYLVSFLHD